MRLHWTIALIGLAQAQQAHLAPPSAQPGDTSPPPPPSPARSPAPDPTQLLQESKLLLRSITKHSSAYTFPSDPVPCLSRPSQPSLVDWIEASPHGAPLRSLRRAANFVYGGHRSLRHTHTSASRLLGSAVDTVKRKLLSIGSGSDGQPSRAGARRWDERVAFKAGDILSVAEVESGIDHVLKLAYEAAEGGLGEAWLFLGDLYLSGHLSLNPNPVHAVEAYTKASEGWGIPEAQYKLGFLYGSNFANATGPLEGVGEQGSALVHYTFAGLSQYVPASMTIGYRHWVGIGAKKSCEAAHGWYKGAAEEALRTFNAGPPGGRHLPPPKVRLSDLAGGVYGPGASPSYRTPVTGGSKSQTRQEWDDLVEWYSFHAEKGEVDYMLQLARVLYAGFGGEGLGGTRGGQSRLKVGAEPLQDRLADGGRDFYGALRWFGKAARRVWAKEPSEAMVDPNWAKLAPADRPQAGFYDQTKDPKNARAEGKEGVIGAVAAGMLGKMYLRGEGVKQDFAKAFVWFSRGSAQGDRESHNGLGIMYRDGLGMQRDLKKAINFFQSAAQADHADGQVNLGKYHFGRGEWQQAQQLFEQAVRIDSHRQPDTFQAYYYLAELSNRAGQGTCPAAVAFYKSVVERGDWEHEVWWEAERARLGGDERTALLGYWIMAERGYEVAQNNVAYLLDRSKNRLRLPGAEQAPKSSPADRLALTFWTRSAAQDNMDALVKMGDYYFDGVGTADGLPRLDKAAAAYQSAATSRISAMSMWNLGWMHEHGKGVARDYHLAKRFYDLAIETSMEAYLPATLSLMGLYARSLYHTLFGKDEELKLLSLFNGPAASSPAELLAAQAPTINAWSVDRTWRAVQRQWGIDPGPDPAIAAPPGQQPGAGAARNTGAQAQQQLREVKGKMEDVLKRFDEDRGDDWVGQGERERREGEDEFSFGDGESDLGGTVAIVMLCIFLGVLFMMRQNAMPAANAHRQQANPPPPAPGAAPQAPAPAAAPTPAPAEAGARPQAQDEAADGADVAGDDTETEPDGAAD